MRPFHALTDLDELKAPCARHTLLATTIVVLKNLLLFASRTRILFMDLSFDMTLV